MVNKITILMALMIMIIPTATNAASLVYQPGATGIDSMMVNGTSIMYNRGASSSAYGFGWGNGQRLLAKINFTDMNISWAENNTLVFTSVTLDVKASPDSFAGNAGANIYLMVTDWDEGVTDGNPGNASCYANSTNGGVLWGGGATCTTLSCLCGRAGTDFVLLNNVSIDHLNATFNNIFSINFTNMSWFNGWFNGNISNYGMIFTYDINETHSVSGRSSDVSTSSFRPKWTFEYTEGNAIPDTPTIIYPTDGMYLLSQTFQVNYSGGDADGDTLTFYTFVNNSLNVTSTGNITINISDGSYDLKVMSGDGKNYSSNSSTIRFYVDATPPSYSNLQNNASTTTKYGGNISFGVVLIEAVSNLSYYRFSYNDSGVWTNRTAILIPSSGIINETMVVTKTRGLTVCGRFWFNDSNGNENDTAESCFVVINTIPNVENLTINSPKKSDENLNFSVAFRDVDDDSWTLNWTKWFRNNTINDTLENQTIVQYQNISIGDVWNVMMSVYDGFGWSNWTNSSNITVVSETTPPTISNASLSSTTGNTGTAFTIFSNCSDVNGLATNFPKVEVLDPNSALTNYSMTGTNQYTKSYNPSIVGTYNFSFYCQDTNGNIATNFSWQNALKYVATSAGGNGGGGGGGGGPPSQTPIIINATPERTCGDSKCSSEDCGIIGGYCESPLNCPADCQFNTTYIFCDDPNQPCWYRDREGTVIKIMALMVPIGIIGLALGGTITEKLKKAGSKMFKKKRKVI